MSKKQKYSILGILVLIIFFQLKVNAMDSETLSKKEQILMFWFGELNNSYEWDSQKSNLWFMGNEELDSRIREMYGEDIIQAASGNYSDWEQTPRGRLALIILFDQFPRNVFRGTPKAYAFDALALQISVEGIEKGFDQELYPIERQFFYLPLMHSEDIEYQQLSLQMFEKLKEESDVSTKEYFLNVEKYAKDHFEIVQTFGRFPHRNAILNRANTDAETLYLNRSTSTYGQSPKPNASNSP